MEVILYGMWVFWSQNYSYKVLWPTLKKGSDLCSAWKGEDRKIKLLDHGGSELSLPLLRKKLHWDVAVKQQSGFQNMQWYYPLYM